MRVDPLERALDGPPLQVPWVLGAARQHVGRVSTEARWFVQGDVEGQLRPSGRVAVRVDVYYLDSLGPSSSLKRRNGDGPLEYKARIGPAAPCLLGGVHGLAEQWIKRQVSERGLKRLLAGPQIEVRKQRWRRRGAEICLLQFGGEQWWTVAAHVEGGRSSRTTRDLLTLWGPVLSTAGEAMSYPVWLRERSKEHGGSPGRSELDGQMEQEAL